MATQLHNRIFENMIKRFPSLGEIDALIRRVAMLCSSKTTRPPPSSTILLTLVVSAGKRDRAFPPMFASHWPAAHGRSNQRQRRLTFNDQAQGVPVFQETDRAR
jgi:hypothetical protein